MIDAYVEKSPTEEKYYDADFASEIPSGDSLRPKTVGSATTVVITDSTGFDCSAAMAETVAISSTKVRIKLVGGANGMDYRMLVRAEMYSAGTVFDKFYEIRVRVLRRTF